MYDDTSLPSILERNGCLLSTMDISENSNRPAGESTTRPALCQQIFNESAFSTYLDTLWMNSRLRQ
jgi:hypothetical protein